jgi:hypothetical protein
MHTQSLGFSLRIARTHHEVEVACAVRARSYGHHLPQLEAALVKPDSLDGDENTVVVLCVDKASGHAIGTARFQTNAGGPLLIERSVAVPDSIRGDTRAEISRFSAVPGADPLVKLALMKASYLFCVATQVRWMVICARSDALARQYRRLGFRNLFSDRPMMPMLHVGSLPHHVLSFNVTTAESTWRETQHPLYAFMIETAHPDIHLFSSQPVSPRHPPPARPWRSSAQPTISSVGRKRPPALRVG